VRTISIGTSEKFGVWGTEFGGFPKRQATEGSNTLVTQRDVCLSRDERLDITIIVRLHCKAAYLPQDKYTSLSIVVFHFCDSTPLLHHISFRTLSWHPCTKLQSCSFIQWSAQAIRYTLTQTDQTQPLQVEVNYKKAENFIRAAALQGANLAVLPEYHLAGWVPNEPKFREAAARWQTYLDKYCALAKELEICIVPGTIVELHTDTSIDKTGIVEGEENEAGERLLNVAYFIDDKGNVAGKYVKKNLWGSTERGHLTSSARDPHPVFDTPLGKVGMLICWDLAFPEAFREMIVQGAKIIIVPTFWLHTDCTAEGLSHNPASEALFLNSIITSRCFENTCGEYDRATTNECRLTILAVVFCNAGGPSGGGYCGLSQVCAPYVGPIVKMGSYAEGMAVGDLDMQIMEDAEANYQVRADLTRDGWHYDYRHSSVDRQ